MGALEDKVRRDINTKFGSIPRMAAEAGIPKNTIYHALERGLDNTTVKTRNQIYSALYDCSSSLDDLASGLSDDEVKLISLYRSLPDKGRSAVLAGLKEYAKRS